MFVSNRTYVCAHVIEIRPARQRAEEEKGREGNRLQAQKRRQHAKETCTLLIRQRARYECRHNQEAT